MNIYRDGRTGRLVKLFEVSPRTVLGSHFETEGLITGETRKLTSLDHLTLAAER